VRTRVTAIFHPANVGANVRKRNRVTDKARQAKRSPGSDSKGEKTEYTHVHAPTRAREQENERMRKRKQQERSNARACASARQRQRKTEEG